MTGGATEPKVLDAALQGLCPRCGSMTLFAGFIRFAPSCRTCPLDFSAFNVGDGPAAFLTLIIGTVVTVLAIVVELAFEPPLWAHLVLWVPLTLGLVLGSLRLAKAALLALEYRNRAREGRVDSR
jgi:uncharacterized protein (DUF983 family)